MTSLYIAQPGERIDNICQGGCHAPATNGRFDPPAYRTQFNTLNPRFKDKELVQGYQPVLLPDDLPVTVNITENSCQLSGEDARRLGLIADDIGGANVMALAAFASKYDLYSKAADLNTFGGGGLGAATARSSAFLMALDDYDKALMNYEELRNHRATTNTQLQAKVKMEQAFRVLQTEFNREAKSFLQQPVRTTTSIIESHSGPRVVARSIPLTSQNSMQSLAKFAKYGKSAGYGMVALDGYFRYQQVSALKQSGGNWEREAWAQGAGLTVGLVVGGAAFAILLAPAGLVLGVVIAGGLAFGFDKATTEGTKYLYNAINN